MSVLLWANAAGALTSQVARVSALSGPFPGTIAALAPAPLAGNQNADAPHGFDFDVVGCNPIVVTQLGAFDDNQDGLRRAIRVYIYDRDTRTAVVGPVEFSPGDDGQLFGGHRFKPLVPPVILPPGFRGTAVAENYGAEERQWNEHWGNPEDLATLDTGGGLIRFVGSGRWGATQGAYPDIIDSKSQPVGTHGGTFVFEAAPGPTIGAPPVPISVAVGEDAAFGVTASGVEPLSYQWWVKGIDMAWTDIPLANEPELLLTNVTEASAGHYRVVVTDGNGDERCAQARLVVEQPNTPMEPAFFREDFEDDDAGDGNPVTWNTVAPSTGRVVNGSYILTSTDYDWLVWASPAEFQSIGDVSLRTKMRAVRSVPATYTGLLLAAHGGSQGFYWAYIKSSAGSGYIEVGDGTVLGSASLPLDIFAADVNVQFDVLGNQLSLTVWQDGETKPAQPQVTRTSSRNLAPSTVSFAMQNGMREMAVRYFDAIAIGDSLPRIVQEPQDQTVLPGDTALLNVTATGPGYLGYQWWKDGAMLDGATNATLTLTDVDDSMAGLYSVVVTCQQTTLTSAPARLTVSPLFITAQPESQTVNAGSDATFSVSVASTLPVNYQWRLSGNDLEGATDSVLILSGVSQADEGDYSVVASNAHGAVTSQVARLSVLVRPVIVQAPLSQSVVEGGSVTFSVEITGNPPPFGYQWRKGATILDTIPSFERLAFYSLENVQADEGGLYRVVITNAAVPTIGGGSPNATWTLTVLPDGDQDGLPDAWEAEHEVSNPDDDPDDDGLTNREEYEAGTDPNDPKSNFRIVRLNQTGRATIEFAAVSNKTYTVQYTDELGGGSWSKLADILARATNRVEAVHDAAPADHRYYRVVTPRQD